MQARRIGVVLLFCLYFVSNLYSQQATPRRAGQQPAAQQQAMQIARLAAAELVAATSETLVLTADIPDAARGRFLIFGTVGNPVEFPFSGAYHMGLGRLDRNGIGSLAYAIPPDMPSTFCYSFCAFYQKPTGEIDVTETTLFARGGPACEEIDLHYAPGCVTLDPGTMLDDEYQDAGITIQAFNNNLNHPDQAILFDSQNPTGGDDDLATQQYGNLVIIAEDVVDGDNDGLVDDPDDERYGGEIRYVFGEEVTACSITLVDIDDNGAGTWIETLNGASQVEIIQVPDLGDNSIQTLLFQPSKITELRVHLAGSGGIAQMDRIPCPQGINFDATVTGAPLGLQAGEKINSQFAYAGVEVTAMNNLPKHPDQAILFDSANPTGGDDDLITPGYGPGNLEAEKLLLILAENVKDEDNDGLVDNPDDEQYGGNITFHYAFPVTLQWAKVIDFEDDNSFFEAFDSGGVSQGIFPISGLGDNSAETISFNNLGGISKLVLTLAGSGGLAELRFCPD